MRARSGQVAIYLVLTLVALTVLVLMNVGAYLSVTAKNQTMNAGDAAAVAAANHQVWLLNRVGQMNVDHLVAAITNDLAECTKLEEDQRRAVFLGPICGTAVEGWGCDPSLPYGCFSAANRAAQMKGAVQNSAMQKLLQDHADEIRRDYETNPLLYPEPWDGAWEEYATALGSAASSGVYAGPDNIDYMDAADEHLLINQQFYNAIAGRCWCWFNFNAPGLLGTFTGFADWEPLPTAEDEARQRKSVNSEIYSLHLARRTGSAVEILGADLILRILKDYGSRSYTMEDIEKSYVITNRNQVWYLLDKTHWRNWWEIDPDGIWNFPARGKVLPKYDVRGCAAVCRVISGPIPDLIFSGDDVPAENIFNAKFNAVGPEGDPESDFGPAAETDVTRLASDDRRTSWSAAAKPFGCLINRYGDEVSVDDEEFRRFVLPCFTEARLVPLDAAGGREPGYPSSDPIWSEHVRRHLQEYLKTGFLHTGSCWYCQQILSWTMPSFQSEGRNWLSIHAHECRRPTASGDLRGGTPHGH